MKNLTTSFRINGKYYAAVDDITIDIMKNEVFAIVGESGCGKSALALSITKLHNMNYTKINGEIIYNNQNINSLNEKELNKIRGKYISMVFQDPLIALNPLIRIGTQIEEPLIYHTLLNKKERKNLTLELLNDVGIKSPSTTYMAFPHELSGGMRQRVMIALALSCKPSLIIADEPTTALDVTIQAQILDTLRKLQEESKSSIILITHDLGVVAEIATRVAVMYAGQFVEYAEVNDLFKNPCHPYTRSLLASMPSINDNTNRLNTISGNVPTLKDMATKGCRFSYRNTSISKVSHQPNPTYHKISKNHFVLCTCYKDFHL